MSRKASMSRRLPQKGVGILLSLALVGYMVMVGIKGGLLANPQRPQTRKALREKLEEFRIQNQDAGHLFKQALNPRGGSTTSVRKAQYRGIEAIRGRIQFHEDLAFGRLTPGDGYSTDFNAFLRDDYPQFPADFKVEASSVENKTVYFKKPYHYEILGASKDSVESVFKEYLGTLVDLQWKVGRSVFLPEGPTGVISAQHKKWHLAIGVLKQNVFPDEPTTVFWRLDRMPGTYDSESHLDDRTARPFIYILDPYTFLFDDNY